MSGNVSQNGNVYTVIENAVSHTTIYAKPSTTLIGKIVNKSENCEELSLEKLEKSAEELKLGVRDLTQVCTQKRFDCNQLQGNTSYNDAITKAILRGDFTVYQGGDLNEFFNCEAAAAPKRVADVCLVNDHYILVKVPPMQRRDSNAPCILEEEEEEGGEDIAPGSIGFNRISPAREESTRGRKLVKYLHCGTNRSRRVSPSPADPFKDGMARPQLDSRKLWGDNNNVQEVFKSRTALRPKINAFESSGSGATVESEQPTERSEEIPESNVAKPTVRTYLQEIQRTSLSNEVDLEAHGHLEMPKIDTPQSKKSSKKSLPRPRRPLGGLTLRWFLRPFRARSKSRKVTTANKKIQAVVYKTYFVKWVKATPESQCTSCRRLKHQLKRSRSANF